MKKCTNCQKLFDNEKNFCPKCGFELSDYLCDNCQTLIDDDSAAFCFNCGAKLNLCMDDQVKDKSDLIGVANEKVRENELVKSVKEDFINSQSLNMVKNKVKETAETVKEKSSNINPHRKKKVKIIACIVAGTMLFIVIATHIHMCDECGETYFGKKHIVEFWDEKENICQDCYNNYFGIQ